MHHVRSQADLLIPYELDAVHLRSTTNRLPPSLQQMLQATVDTKEFGRLWLDPEITLFLQRCCIFCGQDGLLPGELLVHLIVEHQPHFWGHQHYVQQLRACVPRSNVNDYECHACGAVFNLPHADPTVQSAEARTQLVQSHFQFGRPVVLQIAFFLTGHGRFCRLAHGSSRIRDHDSMGEPGCADASTAGADRPEASTRGRKRTPSAAAEPRQLARPNPSHAASDAQSGSIVGATARTRASQPEITRYLRALPADGSTGGHSPDHCQDRVVETTEAGGQPNTTPSLCTGPDSVPGAPQQSLQNSAELLRSQGQGSVRTRNLILEDGSRSLQKWDSGKSQLVQVTDRTPLSMDAMIKMLTEIVESFQEIRAVQKFQAMGPMGQKTLPWKGPTIRMK